MNTSNRLKTIACVSTLCALLTAACDTGSGSTAGNGGSDNPATPAKTGASDTFNPTPSKSDLVGTWHASETTTLYDKGDADGDGNRAERVGTQTLEATIRFGEDGSLTYAITTAKKSGTTTDVSSVAESGTYGIAENGILTYVTTKKCESDTASLNIDAIPAWTAHDAEKSFEPIAVCGGKLYGDVMKRTETGSGINGTWSVEFGNTEDEGFVYKKIEYIINDGTITRHHSSKLNDPANAYALNDGKTRAYAYTQKDPSTLVLDETAEHTREDWLFFQSGDYLVIGPGAICATKQ